MFSESYQCRAPSKTCASVYMQLVWYERGQMDSQLGKQLLIRSMEIHEKEEKEKENGEI